MSAPTLPVSINANPMLDRWISVDTPGRITVRSGKVELGQGSVTAIAAIAAGELGVRLDQIDIVAGDTRSTPNEGFTAGSLSIEHGGAGMRWAAASARALFAQAAAEALGVTVDALALQDGVFSAPGRNVSVDYWALAPRVDLACSMKDAPAPAMTGRVADDDGLRRIDLAAKLTGAGFIHDMALPGMLYGRVLRPPHPRARLESLDVDAVGALAGVRHVVVDGSFVGVIATRDEQALRAVAKAATLARWRRDGEIAEPGDDHPWLDALPATETVLIDEPAPDAGLAHRVHGRYSRPYIAHASIGPSCAVAHWRDGRLEVWSHTQGVYQLRAAMARALRIEEAAIDIAHRPGAGCYGHNGADDVALDAALLARAVDAPVMTQWSRSDELGSAPFGAAMRVDIEAALDSQGRIALWRETIVSPPHVARPEATPTGVSLLAAQHIAEPFEPAPVRGVPQPSGSSDRNAVPIYAIGGRRIVNRSTPQGPLRSSALRSLGAHCNVFAIEQTMDELAARAGVDPLRFRLAHLEDARSRAVLERVARMANWRDNAAGGEGLGRGIGFARYKSIGAWCAVIADVEVDEKVRLKTLYAAVDCGRAVFVDGVVNQIEGGLLQAASWTLKEAVRWTRDGVETRSWDDYPILSFSETPSIKVEIIDRPNDPPLGAGECAAGPLAGAVGNALAHALGVRVRAMPLTPERIAQAINAGD